MREQFVICICPLCGNFLGAIEVDEECCGVSAECEECNADFQFYEDGKMYTRDELLYQRQRRVERIQRLKEERMKQKEKGKEE